jgi:hypothetical protein
MHPILYPKDNRFDPTSPTSIDDPSRSNLFGPAPIQNRLHEKSFKRWEYFPPQAIDKANAAGGVWAT